MALQDDFLVNENPVILIEMDFDGGELNFWTRPFAGQHAGKSYAPIAGITGAFSIRHSLDQPSLGATAQITGAAGEILAAALTETFQGRPARIRLANLNASGAITNVESLLIGEIQDIPIVDSPDGVTTAVQIESVFSRIGRARDLRYSKADQAVFDPNDSIFDAVSTATVREPPFGG